MPGTCQTAGARICSARTGLWRPTQITFGRYDQITSTRFADRLKNGIRHSELVIFENSGHVPIYDSVAEFNQTTLAFLQRCARGAGV